MITKTAAKLTAENRKALPDSQFAIPELRKYPISDLAHARAALAMVSKHGTPDHKQRVRAAVSKRYPGMGKTAVEYNQAGPYSYLGLLGGAAAGYGLGSRFLKSGPAKGLATIAGLTIGSNIGNRFDPPKQPPKVDPEDYKNTEFWKNHRKGLNKTILDAYHRFEIPTEKMHQMEAEGLIDPSWKEQGFYIAG